MRLVEDLTLFNEDTFELVFIPDELNTFDNPSDIEFRWNVVEFEAE